MSRFDAGLLVAVSACAVLAAYQVGRAVEGGKRIYDVPATCEVTDTVRVNRAILVPAPRPR